MMWRWVSTTGAALTHRSALILKNLIQSVVHFKIDIAAATAIAAVRTASSYEKFPAEADMTVTAFSGSDINFCTVGKHKYLLLI